MKGIPSDLVRGQRLGGIPSSEINAGLAARREQVRGKGFHVAIRPRGKGGDLPVVTGIVKTATPATTECDGNATILGEIEAWPHIPRSAIPAFDSGESYVKGDLVRLTAEPFSEATTYADGDLVLEAGSVYSSSGANAAGTFASGTWTLVDTEGVKCAPAAVAAGTYDGTDWNDVSANATRFIIRSGAVVTLPNAHTGDIVEGVLVKWIGTEIIYGECDAIGGWV